MASTAEPVLLIGCGRMGSALLQGWRRSKALHFGDLMIRVRSSKPAADAAAAEGARLNPPDEALASARTVVLGVKPYAWREVAAAYEPLLAKDAVIVSLLVGTRADDLAQGFGGRRIARVLPTTGVARAGGVATVFAPDSEARGRAHALFDPVAVTPEVQDEGLMDAVGAVSGCGPAYLYAFIQALEDAGRAAGLPDDVARTLARATVTSASAYFAEGGREPGELIAEVASPAGTTEAALKVLRGEGGIGPLMRETVAAAVKRAEELAK
jgi:pyrroline-5-carboxylate reductase